MARKVYNGMATGCRNEVRAMDANPLLRVDNVMKRYQGVWIDSMGTGIYRFEGTASADGKTITLELEPPRPGIVPKVRRPTIT